MHFTKEEHKMSNSVFQSVIVQLKDATDRGLGVMEAEGSVGACTDVTWLGERWSEAAVKVASSNEPPIVCNQKPFTPMVSSSN